MLFLVDYYTNRLRCMNSSNEILWHFLCTSEDEETESDRVKYLPGKTVDLKCNDSLQKY